MFYAALCTVLLSNTIRLYARMISYWHMGNKHRRVLIYFLFTTVGLIGLCVVAVLYGSDGSRWWLAFGTMLALFASSIITAIGANETRKHMQSLSPGTYILIRIIEFASLFAVVGFLAAFIFLWLAVTIA